jgi:hypothetical protein
MTAQISNELEEAMFGDAAILRYLSDCEAAFKSGDRSALFTALTICARAQAVLPDWAADAIIEGEDELSSGKRKDFNELFGWTREKRATKERKAMIMEKAATVLAKLTSHRVEGGSWNLDEGLGKVSEETRVPRRVVEAIYKRYGQNIKNIPKGGAEGAGYASIFTNLPLPRRRGRPIL